jgi:hypothetical protein
MAALAGSVLGLAPPAGASDGVAAAVRVAPPAGATNGAAAAAASPTYYQQMTGSQPLSAVESASPGVPTVLAIDNSTATVEYLPAPQPDGSILWDVFVQGFQRNTERVNAVYDMVFVLPLPITASGTANFSPVDSAIIAQTGSPSAPVPLLYGGEKIVLKHNVGLEKTLLPGLVGNPSHGKLPSLAGTGYGYTLWDMIVQYDSGYGPTIEGWASFHYATSSAVSAPAASDSRMKAYLITWIPALNSNIPAYAVRMAVQNPSAP